LAYIRQAGTAWLLLLHQIPPNPRYFRAQSLRRLMQVGALPLKNSAYLLPEGDDALEDFQWIRGEITQQGGSAWLFRVESIAGMTNAEIRTAFQEARAADYRRLLEEARNLHTRVGEVSSDGIFAAVAKLARRVQQTRRIDFFDSPGYEELAGAMRELEEQLEASVTTGKPVARIEGQKRRWVTRRGIKVDRIASAWLIRRFIDAQATFRFVDPESYALEEGEVRFDMFDGEFTHQGELCTFEVLLPSTGVADAGLRTIAEIVHDIDLKEQRYDRPETTGVSRMISGVCARSASDEMRLELGLGLFDSLYEGLRSEF
jgi:hypothetical protein